jgi:hypothetical protein
MTRSTQWPPKTKTPAQRASEANRLAQMAVNVQLGRPTPPPRERVVASATYEDRFKTPSHRR